MAKQALGILETKGLVSLIEGADAALKSADITMIGWTKIGSGLVTGFFAAVKAGIDAGAEAASQLGDVASVQVIPRPHDDLEGFVSFS
jgi:ethanolamine utilization protein EutM